MSGDGVPSSAGLRLKQGVLLLFGILIASPLLALLSVLFIVLSQFDGNGELPAECAVVFGAAVYGLDRPGPAIVRRVTGAATYYKEGRIERVILAGGKGRGNLQSEAQVMKTVAVEQGIDPQDIVLEQSSQSTIENLIFSQNLTSDCSSIVAISDQYHLARISLLAGRIGWGELQTIPTTQRPPNVSEIRSIGREVIAYVYYALHIDEFIALPRTGESIES